MDFKSSSEAQFIYFLRSHICHEFSCSYSFGTNSKLEVSGLIAFEHKILTSLVLKGTCAFCYFPNLYNML